MLEIVAPREFRHAGQLPGVVSSNDPREPAFNESQIGIDLRKCEFVYPPAVVWCAVFAALVRLRGVPCRLLIPENFGVAVYLKSLGLFSMLQAKDVEIDDAGINWVVDHQSVLPLTSFRTVSEAEDLANQALEQLHATGGVAANLKVAVSEAFGELGNNAAQHSESEVGSFGLIQFYDTARGQRFICAVGDGGIGIRASLARNPALRHLVPYDHTAIDLAVKERVSGTGEPTRGIGLSDVAMGMRVTGRSLIIHSGIGMLEINEKIESRATRSKRFAGTLAAASIPV